MSPRPPTGPGRGVGGSPAGDPPRERGWRAARREHPRLTRLIAFAPLALIVSVLVLLLGLPWWALAFGVAALAYMLAFHS
jgi:hypothetical protein